MKVFAINDCDWWMAETLEQAKTDYLKGGHGLESDDCFDNPHEVSEADMSRLKFVFGDGPEKASHSFAVELANRVALGSGSEFFASTEY